MDISLRDAILNRVKGKNAQELREVIESSLGGDDMALPGLGVLLEIIWSNSDSDTKENLVAILEKGLK